MYVLFDLHEACNQKFDKSLAGRCNIADFSIVTPPDQVGINLAAVDDKFDDFGRPTLLAWPSDGFVLTEAIE
jgi:hypothetical protein